MVRLLYKTLETIFGVKIAAATTAAAQAVKEMRKTLEKEAFCGSCFIFFVAVSVLG